MKYNYDKYPILRIVEKGEVDCIKQILPLSVTCAGKSGYIPDAERIRFKELGNQVMFGPLYSLLRNARDKVRTCFLSKEFIKCVCESKDRFYDWRIIKNIKEGYYCFIGSSIDQSVFRISFNTERTSLLLDFLTLAKGTNNYCSHGTIAYGNETDTFLIDTSSKSVFFSRQHPSEVFEFDVTHVGYLLITTLFIQYAKVETKILPPKSKTMGIGCYYNNTTKSKITMLDSKWFTTLVKSDAFKVRGHFRLQPKKVNGEWTKELIWINEFEKTGYTAPAKKIAAYGEESKLKSDD